MEFDEMEFDEMKKIWSTQDNEPLYVINEAALHKTILSGRNKGEHITNVSELLSIVVNFAAGVFILGTNVFSKSANIPMYILAVWMFATGMYCVAGRVRRKRGDQQFDRTMLGDLDHAVSIATYQVRFSGLLRWNILPVGGLTLIGIWESDKAVGLAIGLALFFILTFYASGWEHNYYRSRLRNMEELREMLLK
jgi:hypothetical protein